MNKIDISKKININNPNISTNTQNTKPQKSFQEVLNNIGKDKEIKFSKHALSRLKTRNINLSKMELDKINGAIKKANKKGVKEALILMDNKAFIASVKNNTIITAANDKQLKESVFTNIDGAVIL